MRSVLVTVLFSLAACGGTSASRDAGVDLGASACPQSIHDVDDGEACGDVDVECSPCTGCGACEELFCENGTWIHVLEQSTCDGGSPGA